MWKLSRKLAAFSIVFLLSEPLILAYHLPFISTAQNNNVSVLALNASIRKDLSKGESHSYQIMLKSGQYLRALVDRMGIYVSMTMYAPSGQKLTELHCREYGPTPLSLIAEAPGFYRLQVRSLEKETTVGSYEVRIEQVRPATAQDRIRIVAERLYAEGEQLRADGKAESNRKAIKKYGESLSYWRIAGDKREEASTFLRIGEIYHPLGEPRKALEYYNQALSLNQEMNDLHLQSETLNDIGYVYIYLGENQKALEYCKRALKLSQEVKNRRGQAKAFNNIGEVYYAFRDRQKAIEHYQQALPLWRELNDRYGQAQTLLYIGYSQSDLNYLDKALDSYNQALSLWRAVSDTRGQAMTLTAIGHLYSRSGKKQEAFDFYSWARPLVKMAGDPIEEATLISGIATVYQELGEKQKTLELYNESLKLFRAASYRQGEANLLVVISEMYYSMGMYKKALAYSQKALLVIKSLNDQTLEFYALKTVAAIYYSQGDKKKALDFYNQAISVCRKVGERRGEAYALNGIGSIYDSWGEKEKALDYHNQALMLNREVGDRFGEVTTLFNIARIERDLNKLTEARTHTEEATERIESLRSDVASQELRASFIATVRQNFELHVDILARQHKLHPADGLDAAALHISERARARSLIEMLAEAKVDFKEGADGALLERQRALQQLLSDKADRYSRLFSGKHTPEQVAAAAKEIEAVTTDFQQVQAQIRSTSPRYAALTQPQPLSLKQIQEQVLDRDTMLLEYALGDDRSYLWAVTMDSIATFELPRRAEIEKSARRVYQLLTAQNEIIKGETDQRRDARILKANAEYAKASAELSRMILGPVASNLSNKRLLIVSDGALQYIPFAALPAPQSSVVSGQWSVAGSKTTDNGQRTTDEYKPLVIDHEIVSLPSASALAVLRREIADRKPAPKAIAVIADPVFSRNDLRFNSAATRSRSQARAQSLTRDFERAIKEVGATRGGNELQRLPFSRREAEAIAAIAPEGQVMKVVEFDASRDKVMSADLSQYRIIHFATHGMLNSEHPELSGIVLSLVDRLGQPQNGFLRLHDVYNLNLPAELVVLSACQTGLGKEIKGEGLVGLTQGFMYAGAARVMASLWKVDDAATAELMKRFYTKALGGNMRPAAALKEAQVEMWKQKNYQSPYFWAGFVLQGEWK